MTKRKWISGGMAVAALTLGLARATDLPVAEPDASGFSAERLDNIDKFYAGRVSRGEMAGIVILIARHGKIVHFNAVGYADVDKKEKMTTDSIFRLESMTKTIASTALMMLYEEGKFQLSDPLSKYIPEFANLRVMRTPDGALDDTVPMQREPTVEDALRHTAGFTHGIFYNQPYDAQFSKANVFSPDISLAEMMTRVSKIPLRYQPGTQWVYSIGADIQARLVEVLSGMPYAEFLQKRMFKPLQMKDASWWVPPDKAKRLATVYWIKQGKLVPVDAAHGGPANNIEMNPAIVNSYNVDPKLKGGSVGLFSTVEDYWRFAQMLANGGVLDGARVLGPQTIEFMMRDHLHALNSDKPLKGLSDVGFDGIGFGLGFGVIEDPAAAGYTSSVGSFGWSGGAQTHFWIDPKEDMVVVAMTQQFWNLDTGKVLSLWKQLHTMVYGALVK